jgi:hypothetical protein
VKELDRKNWQLYEDAEGNCIFPIQGESSPDFIVWLVHGNCRVALQIPGAYLRGRYEQNTP